jgi:X-Pro dipeptidyl-peptidase
MAKPVNRAKPGGEGTGDPRVELLRMPVVRVLLASALVAAGVAISSSAIAQETVVTEIYHVPTVDDAVIRVEVTRDTSFAAVPVILTYSPYNNLNEPNPSHEALADRYVPQGYARAVADVLGTRGSTGCWDYGGPAEQQSGVDVVKFLAAQPWSNGKVAMIGASYEGTTASMVAARGPDVPELKAVVPIAAISHWYGYAYGWGVRYFLNSTRPTDEGFDTPLAFDFGFGRTVAPDPADPNFAETLEDRFDPCESLQHTEEGYSRQPDYDQFWLDRSYRKDASGFRAAVFLTHGWQDFNVKQEEAIALWEALPVDDPRTAAVEGVPFKRLYMTQDAHSRASLGDEWYGLLDRFLAHTLKGVRNGINRPPVAVTTFGRTVTDAGAYQTLPASQEKNWPPRGTRDLTLHLHRTFDQDIPGVTVPPPGTGETGTLELQPADDGFFTYIDDGATSEELTLNDPLNEPGHGYYSLFYRSSPLARPVRLAGAAELDFWVRTQSQHQHLTPLLVDVLPSGQLRLVERGFLNLDYRNGLGQADPLEAGEWGHGVVEFLPQDFRFPAGHRIGLILQSSNTVWAVPGAAGVVNVAHGPVGDVVPVGTSLVLPVVNPPGALFTD